MRRNDLVVLILTAAAACTDALSYLGLGKIFPANMTGNTVLLGIGLSSGDEWRAARSALALLAFVVGAGVGALLGADRDKRRALAWAVGLELALVGSACGWWLATGAHLDGPTQAGLIVLVSLAMGVQSAAVGALGVGVTATYITGTWTQVGTWVATAWHGRRREAAADQQTGTHVRQVVVLVCYFGAAALAAFLHREIGTAAIVLPTGLLAVALVESVVTVRTPAQAHDRRSATTPASDRSAPR